jgi:transposase
MEVIVSRGCGLDVHQATVVACLLVGEPGTAPRKQVKTFSTMTSSLIELRDFLAAAGCTVVAMEATGGFCCKKRAVCGQD